MAIVGHVAQAFAPLTALLARMRGNATVYQQLRLAPHSELEEGPPASLWTRHSLYYCISFLSNILLVICSLSGYIISSDRDSDHEPRNCARFTIVGVYALPTMIATGFLLLSAWNKSVRHSKISEAGTHVHIKLAVFCALNSALSFIFMDIYALGLDDPDTRFGTSADIRNWLLRLIILSAAVSFLSLSISVITTLLATRRRNLDIMPTALTWSPNDPESPQSPSMKRFDSI